jgi:hypothetical protein
VMLFGPKPFRVTCVQQLSSDHSALPQLKPAEVDNPLELSFVNPRNVEWRIANKSSSVVQNALYYFGIFNLDRPELNRRVLPSGETGVEPFRIPVQKADFVNPDQPIGGQILSVGMEPMINPGERIFGFAFTNCPGCKRVDYWFYFKEGEGGWYTKASQQGVIFPAGIYQNATKTLDDLVPVELRRPIK